LASPVLLGDDLPAKAAVASLSRAGIRFAWPFAYVTRGRSRAWLVALRVPDLGSVCDGHSQGGITCGTGPVGGVAAPARR